MRWTPKRRAMVLAVGLVATLGAVKWVDSREKSLVASGPDAVHHPNIRNPSLPKIEVDLSKLNRDLGSDEVGELFTTKSWQPPTPPPALSKSEPVAPPLPFTYIGRLEETEGSTVFLSRDNRNYVVRTGDTLDNTYQVKEISDHAVIMTHLPTGISQTLIVDGAN